MLINLIHRPYAFGYWLLIMTVLTWILFWLDKRSARRSGPRMPERLLLLGCFLGGGLGGLTAIYGLRHKTRKGGFVFLVWISVVVWAIFCYMLQS